METLTPSESEPLVTEANRDPSDSWVEVTRHIAESKARIRGLERLKNQGIGLNQIEDFLAKNSDLCRVLEDQGMEERMVIELLMGKKIRDEKKNLKSLKKKKNELREGAKRRWGTNSRKYRRLVREQNELERKRRVVCSEKFEEKIAHLRKKREKVAVERKRKRKKELVSKWRERYPGLHVHMEHEEVPDERELEKERLQDVLVLGGSNLEDEEKAILKYPPKMRVMENLSKEEFEFEEEIAFMKDRWERWRILNHDE